MKQPKPNPTGDVRLNKPLYITGNQVLKGRITVANTHIDDWVNKKRVCKLLDISESTLKNYRSRGVIAWSKVEGKIYYYLPGIIQLLEANMYLDKPTLK